MAFLCFSFSVTHLFHFVSFHVILLTAFLCKILLLLFHHNFTTDICHFCAQSFFTYFFLISQLFISFPNKTFILFSFLILYLFHIISVKDFFLLLILNSTSLVLYFFLSIEFFLFFILNSTSLCFYCHIRYFSYSSYFNKYSSDSISVHNISLTFHS